MSDKKAILLRIPRELWERVNAWSADELRSVNGQIEFVLREALRRRARDGGNVESQDVNRQKSGEGNVNNQNVHGPKREGGNVESQPVGHQKGEEEDVNNQNVDGQKGEGGGPMSGKEIIARAIHEYARAAGAARRKRRKEGGTEGEG